MPPKVIETRVIGKSVQGRDIVAERMGTPGGRVVLIIGVIHGDEQKGMEVTKLLRTMPTPKGIDLWLVDTMNPDGVAMNTRGNANKVDLNRNFELGWSYIPLDPSHGQYSGEAPADQPETQAVQTFLFDVKPALVLWFHQDANVITDQRRPARDPDRLRQARRPRHGQRAVQPALHRHRVDVREQRPRRDELPRRAARLGEGHPGDGPDPRRARSSPSP